MRDLPGFSPGTHTEGEAVALCSSFAIWRRVVVMGVLTLLWQET